jgi:hypothetical protein
LAFLAAEAQVVGVGLDQAVILRSRSVTLDSLLGYIDSDQPQQRRAASLIMEQWTKAVDARTEKIKNLRGATPKETVPLPELGKDESWYQIGIDDWGRIEILKAHNCLR